MNWEALGAVGEIVAAVGVIVSLVYLGLQIRQNNRHLDQNTRAVQTSAYHQANEQGWLVNLTFAQHEDLAVLTMRGLSDPQALNEQERVRFVALMTPGLFNMENMLRLYEQELIDEDVWQNWLDNSMATIRLPGFQWLLDQRPGVLTARVREAVAARLDARSSAL
jgi:hypothetical protein